MVDEPRVGLGQAERPETPTTPVWHPDFSANARSRKSLVYSSADGTLFALNEARVACNASALPRVPPSADAGATGHLATGRQSICLPESTKTLAVLFQFILPRTPPTLQDLAIDELVDVVQAARNYKIYTVVSFWRISDTVSDVFIEKKQPPLLTFGALVRRSLAAHHAEIVFLYGIKNRLPHLMDAGAPAVYRDAKREELLAICDTHGILYAWSRYQLLWDRILKEACGIASGDTNQDCVYQRYRLGEGRIVDICGGPPKRTNTNVAICVSKGRHIYEHFNRLRSFEWTKRFLASSSSPDVRISKEVPEVSYLEFLGMLDDDTMAIDRGKPWSHTCKTDEVSSPTWVVKYVNDKLKKLIEDLPKFSSFLDSNQKDGDVGFERDDLDSEEEDGSG